MTIRLFANLVFTDEDEENYDDESVYTPLPIYDLKSWVGYRNQFKHPCSSVTKTLSFTRADLVWLEPFLRFSPSLVGHFQTHILGHYFGK